MNQPIQTPDFGVHIPASVLARGDAADELARKVAAGNTEGEPAPAPEDAPKDGVEAPAAEGIPAPKKGEEAPDDDSWKTRYRVLQEKYNAEVPRLHQDLREQAARINDLQSKLLDAVTQTREAAKAVKDTNSGEEKPSYTPDDYGQYGDEFKALALEKESLKAEIKALKESMQAFGQVQVQTQQERFWADLDRLIPGWREQDNDPDFVTWMQERGLHAAFEANCNALNSSSVAAVCNDFRKLSGKNYGSQAPAPADAKPPKDSKPAPSPAPSRSRAGEGSDGKRVYTRDDVKKFFADLNRGTYRGREAEAEAIERDISLAGSEGRIVG